LRTRPRARLARAGTRSIGTRRAEQAIAALAIVGALVSGCATPYPTAYVAVGGPQIHVHGEATAEPITLDDRRDSGVLLVEGHHLDHPSEVVGILDVHLPVGDEQAALAELRARAAALGARSRWCASSSSPIGASALSWPMTS
jgi:hypothetical protein